MVTENHMSMCLKTHLHFLKINENQNISSLIIKTIFFYVQSHGFEVDQCQQKMTPVEKDQTSDTMHRMTGVIFNINMLNSVMIQIRNFCAHNGSRKSMYLILKQLTTPPKTNHLELSKFYYRTIF